MLMEVFDSLRVLTPLSGTLRLLCAIFFGGLIGLDRERKGRAAGFRTYMLVCMGAALTMMLGQYEYLMVTGPWAELSGQLGLKTDVSRFGAQVINGIGFLGAGTIIVTGHQKVKGVTTAAGLWASSCMGIALGAGFYECMIVAFPLILLCFRVLPLVENHISAYSTDMNVYVEFEGMELLDDIFAAVRQMGVQIYDVEIDHGQENYRHMPSAVFSLRLKEKQHHARLLSEFSTIPGVRLIDEV